MLPETKSVGTLLDEIERHARTIIKHREDDYWTGTGCEASMVHDAEDILALVKQLREEGEK